MRRYAGITLIWMECWWYIIRRWWPAAVAVTLRRYRAQCLARWISTRLTTLNYIKQCFTSINHNALFTKGNTNSTTKLLMIQTLLYSIQTINFKPISARLTIPELCLFLCMTAHCIKLKIKWISLSVDMTLLLTLSQWR